MSYVDLFSGIGLAASRNRVLSTVVSANLILKWPSAGIREDDTIPNWLFILNGSSGYIVLPDPAAGSKGFSCVFSNKSVNTIQILNPNLSIVYNIDPSKVVMLILVDPTNGTWETIEIGEAPSQATADNLAGLGMSPFNSKLNVDIKGYNFNTNQVIDVNRRGQLYNWVGAGGVLTLPDASSWPIGYYAYLKNSGSSTITITPSSVNLNGSGSNYSLDVGQSIVLAFNGGEWKTLFDSDPAVLAFTATSLALPASGTKVLTSFEKTFEIMTLTGALSGAVTLDFGSTVGVWYIRDATTGGQAITLKAAGADPGVVPGAGSTFIILSNGVSLTFASPASGSVTSIGTQNGIEGGPITTTGNVGLTATGVTAGSYGGALNAFPGFTVDNRGRLTGATSTNLVADGAQMLAGTANDRIVTPLGAATYYLPRTGGDMSGVIRAKNDAAATAPTYSFVTDTNTGMRRSSEDILAFSTNGADRLSISTTLVTSTLPIRLPGDASNNLDAVPLQQVSALISASATLNRGTSSVIATTSGSAFDVTDIPSWATEISVIVRAVSFSSSALFQVQIGPVGGIVTTGYFSSATSPIGGAQTIGNVSTTGMLIANESGGVVVNGVITLRLLDSTANSWVSATTAARQNTNLAHVGAGQIALSGPLTRVRLMVSAGAFTAGSALVEWRR